MHWCGVSLALALVAPGTTWTPTSVPPELVLGPNSVAVSFDGDRYVFTAVMWSLGIWRYVEP